MSYSHIVKKEKEDGYEIVLIKTDYFMRKEIATICGGVPDKATAEDLKGLLDKSFSAGFELGKRTGGYNG
jgi:hypothetical protein